MFRKKMCNVKPLDSYIRILFASILTIYTYETHSFISAIAVIALFYTAYTRFCFVYYIFKLNVRFSKENYYLSLLPKHRTSPVFIFDKNEKLLFKNASAEKNLLHISSIEDFHIKNYHSIINENIVDIQVHKYNDTCYQIELIPVKSEELLLIYFTDVTEVIELNDEIEETQKEIIYAMGEIGETRSKETGNHVKRVALYSKELALLYGLSSEEANKLHMASPMHDIGKVGIPDAILNAPRKLTKDEFEVMKTHAKLGYHMLEKSKQPILQAAAIVANEHHEKWDGSGYPNGKVAEDIHIYGRITAIADVFDALGSERVYKKAWKLEKILKLFEEESGKHFDPKLVKLFLENQDIFLKIRDTFKDKI